jgi:1-acyl-sn-glycerol-3-phosphate acyltransferase
MKIKSFAFWLFLVLSCFPLFIPACLLFVATAPFDSRRRALHIYCSWWCFLYARIAPVGPITFCGRENLPKNSCILVANHQSSLDIWVLAGLAFPYKWVAKHNMFRIPLVGWSTRMCGYIPIARGRTSSARDMMHRSRTLLGSGENLLIFPEGTRSHGSHVSHFRPGAFKLSRTERTPIVPVIISGTSSAMPKGSLSFRGDGPCIRVRILPAVSPDDFETDKQMADTVRELMSETLAEMSRGSPDRFSRLGPAA